MLSNTLLNKERSGSFKKMDTQKLTFLQSLLIKDTELWQMKDNYTSCRVCGPLQVLYSHKLDLFILKLNEFSWALEKNLQIIGTFSEKENWHSYMIPNPSGFFMIKVISPDSEALIKNFETILSNTVHFLKKGGLEQRLGSYQQHEEKHSGFFDKAINAISETFKPFIPKHKETHANQLIPRTFEQLKDLDSHSVPVIDIPEYKVKLHIKK